MLRPELPYVYCGCTMKCRGVEPVVDRCWPDGSVPSPMRFGRSAPPALVMPPEVVTVNGMPDRMVTKAATCHPPRIAFGHAAVIQPRLALAERQFIGDAECPLAPHVAVGVAAVQLDVPRHNRTVATGAIADLRNVIDGVCPGEGGKRS